MASRQTKTNGTKPAAAKSVPQTSNPKPEPEEQPDLAVISLNSIQEQAIDLCVDLIVHGGALDDVQTVTWGVLAHWYRRKFWDSFEDPKKFEAHLDNFISTRRAEWEGAIQAGGLLNPRREFPDVEEPSPDSPNFATGLLHAHAKRSLIGEFEEFLLDGTPEEISLLRDVIGNRDQPFGEATVALAEGFSTEIGKRTDYVKVRPDLTKQVNAYVAALEAIPLKTKVA